MGLWFILFINATLWIEYVIQPANAKGVVLFFWIQSILLGIENVLKMVFSKTGEPIRINGELRSVTIWTNMFFAVFFTIHFGIFILIFGGMAVISDKIPGNLFNLSWLYPAVIALIVGLILELPGKLNAVHKKSPGLMKLMFFPYIRLLPFLLIFANNNVKIYWLFPLFLFLKTVADLVYHVFVDRPLYSTKTTPDVSV